MAGQDERQVALGNALAQIERQFGKGSIMRMGDFQERMAFEVVPTGSIALVLALGVGGLPREGLGVGRRFGDHDLGIEVRLLREHAQPGCQVAVAPATGDRIEHERPGHRPTLPAQPIVRAAVTPGPGGGRIDPTQNCPLREEVGPQSAGSIDIRCSRSTSAYSRSALPDGACSSPESINSSRLASSSASRARRMLAARSHR